VALAVDHPELQVVQVEDDQVVEVILVQEEEINPSQ
jgi:hypothetical protein